MGICECRLFRFTSPPGSRKTAPPASAALEQIRENALRSILNSETKGPIAMKILVNGRLRHSAAA